MIWVYLWLLGAVSVMAFCIWLDPHMKRRDVPTVVTYNLIAWPMIAVIVIWVEYIEDRDWWDQPLIKRKSE